MATINQTDAKEEDVEEEGEEGRGRRSGRRRIRRRGGGDEERVTNPRTTHRGSGTNSNESSINKSVIYR